MTVGATLAVIGHFLLWAVGLIILLIFVVLALAFIITLFIKFHINISAKIRRGEARKKILFYLKMPFYQYIAYDIDDFDDGTDDETNSDTANDFDNSSSVFDSENIGESVCEKIAWHVTFTGDEITTYAIKPEKFSSEYEIIVHINEEASVEGESTEEVDVEDEFIEETDVEDEFIEDEDDSELENNPFAQFADALAEAFDDFEIESDEDDEKSSYESDSREDELDDLLNSAFSTLSDLEEIKKYVDLSNPSQYAADTAGALRRMSKTTARFVSDILIRSNIKDMSLDLVYGLSDPADTAVSYGAIHTFNASVYAYLLEMEKKSVFSYKRKRAEQISAHLCNDVLITPDMTQETFEADTDLSLSFWMPHLYFPTLRFLLAKNTLWFIRRYVYKYYIRQILKTTMAERKAKREAKKEAKRKTKKEAEAEQSTQNDSEMS